MTPSVAAGGLLAGGCEIVLGERDSERMNGNDAYRAVAEIAASQHGAIHRDQAAKSNVSPRQLRAAVKRGFLWHPVSDIFVFESHARTFRQRCAIASLAGGVVCLRTAAALHGFDGFPERSDGLVEVSFDRRSKRPLPGVRSHTWSHNHQDDIVMVDGIRCTTVARTLVRLGSVCSAEQVEVALDSALRNGASPRWIEQTLDRLRRPGRWGGNVLEAVIRDPRRAGALTESELERLVECVLREQGLPEPVRQFNVETSSGTKRLDLAFPEARLGIEGHSRSVHFGAAANEADNLRDFALAAAGWEILYVTWGMAREPEYFVHTLKQAYRRRVRFLDAG